MSDQNPFKSPSPNPSDVPPPIDGSGSEMGQGELCPHMGFVVIPIPRQGSITRPGEARIEMQSVMQPCQRERCKMWDDNQQDCGFNVQRELMKEIVIGLAPLQKMFGGK